jgi:hypothetical protein
MTLRERLELAKGQVIVLILFNRQLREYLRADGRLNYVGESTIKPGTFFVILDAGWGTPAFDEEEIIDFLTEAEWRRYKL